MAQDSTIIQTSIVKAKGGARAGAGRPKNSTKAYARASNWRSKGVGPLKANDVLLMANERKQWARIFASDDDTVVLKALVFLTSMRDGRPSQNINVTSQTLHIGVDDLERARAIVGELRSIAPNPNLGLSTNVPGDGSPLGLHAPPLSGHEGYVIDNADVTSGVTSVTSSTLDSSKPIESSEARALCSDEPKG